MTKSFDDIVSNYKDPRPEWKVKINGKDYSNNLDLLEFTDSVNNSLKFTVKLDGLDSTDNIPEDSEIIVSKAGGELFRGVLKQVEPDVLNSYVFKGTGYSAELEGNVDQDFENTDVQNVVDTLIDGTNIDTNVSKTFSTSFSGGIAGTTVNDFRARKKQLEEVNRLMGEYDIEWYTTYDVNNDPVFNVTDQISFTDNGSTLDTLTVYGDNQSAEMIKQNANRNKGDFDGVLVRGYGDGEDQITATAGNTGKGNRVLIYTDKTILSDSQAQKRADNINSSKSVSWQEIEVKPSDPNKLYGVGDELTIDAEDARLSGDYRVVETYFKYWPSEDEFESKLTLSNKPQTFVDDFKRQEEQTDSQTDYMQGARNVWGDKEATNATNSDPLEIEFEVPQDVVDKAGNNRLGRIEFNYACKPFKQGANPVDITANNFDPSTKVVSTDVESSGVEMERSNIKTHNHPVGSATSTGAAASESPVLGSGSITNFGVSSGGWSKLFKATEAGGSALDNIEDDLAHVWQLEITAIDTTSNLHIALIGEDADTATADFGYSPDSPTVGESIDFFSKVEVEGGEGRTPAYLWDFGDGTKALGREVSKTFSSSGDKTVTHEFYENSGTTASIVTTDKSNDTIEPSASNLSISSGDLFKVSRSSGLNGVYTVKSVNSGGSARGNDIITVEENVSETYGTGDSDSDKGDCIFFINPTDTASKTVSITSASSLLAGKDVSEMSERETKALQKIKDSQEVIEAEDDISTQDTTIAIGDPSQGDNYYIDNGRDITFDGSIDTDADGNLEVQLLKPGADDSYSTSDDTSDKNDIISITADAGTFQPYTMDLLQQSADAVFEGPGEFAQLITWNGEDGSFILKTDKDNFFVYSASANITSPSDNSTVQQSDVTIEFEGLAGEGCQNADLDVDGSTVKNFDPDGFTLDIYEGNSGTASINGTDYTMQVDNVDDDDQADVTVDGNSFTNVSEGDIITLPEKTDVRLTKITDSDNNGSLLDNYKSVVFEGWFNTSHTETLADGDHTATFIMSTPDDDEDSNHSPASTEEDSVSFTVDTNEPPNADFDYTPSTPAVGEQVQFDDKSSDPDNNIDKWEWDFDGDGTVDETISSGSSGDTTHTYSSTGTYNAKLTVTDTDGESDAHTESITVQDSRSVFDQPYTVDTESVEDVGGTSTNILVEENVKDLSVDKEEENNIKKEDITTQATDLSNPYTVDTESYNQVGTQTTPASDSTYAQINIPIHQQYISDEYELYVATQGNNSPTIDAVARLWQTNHTHDIPRRDDFSEADPEIGAGAENKEVPYQKAKQDQGDVLLDFSTNNESITLDTTINGNDVTITVGNISNILKDIQGVDTGSEIFTVSGDITDALSSGETITVKNSGSGNDGDYTVSSVSYDSNNDETDITVNEDITNSTTEGQIEADGVISNEEQISVNNGTATTANTYQDSELYVRIDSANNKDDFEVRDQSSDDVYTLAATPSDNFRSSKTSQQTDGVSADDGSTQDLVEDVNAGLIPDTTANNVKIYIDDDPTDSNTNSEQEITGDLYNGNSNSGINRDKGLDISDYVDSPGWYRLKIEPDQATFIKSRVFLDHKKDT